MVLEDANEAADKVDRLILLEHNKGSVLLSVMLISILIASTMVIYQHSIILELKISQQYLNKQLADPENVAS